MARLTSRDDSAFHRAPRPLIGWAGVLLIVICVLFVAAVAAAIAVGFWMTAAQGQGVPDMTGGLAVLLPAVATAWGMVAQWMHTRSAERREEIRATGQSAPPFPSPAPSAPSSPTSPPDPSFPGGGLVNNQAIE